MAVNLLCIMQKPVSFSIPEGFCLTNTEKQDTTVIAAP